MKGREARKLFSSILPVVLVLSFLSPLSLSAAAGQEGEESEKRATIATAIEEQLKLAAKGPRLHEDLQNVSGDQEVAVIVHLTEKPVAFEEGIQASRGRTFSQERAVDIKADVEAQQAQVRSELQENNILYEETHSYSTVLNGFSALVKAGDLKRMLELPTIQGIEPDQTVRMAEDAAQLTATTQAASSAVSVPAFLGIDKLWAEGFRGEGVKVAVLDTGIDPDHPEFQGIYKGGKNFVRHSFRYTKPRADNDPSETKPSERPSDQPEINGRGTPYATSHGTHVAGAIAAIGANPFGFQGLAPKVDLYAYRVIGAYESAQLSWILAGIEEAAEQDMDVINLSFEFWSSSESNSIAYAINNAMLAGTIPVLAAISDSPDRSTISPPATSRLGIAVGNTTLPEEKHSGALNAAIGDYTLKRTANLIASTFNENPAEKLTGRYELVAVPEEGRPENYQGIDAAGKVAVVAMGRTTPEEKIRAAKAQGAAAILLHNVANEEKAPEPSGTFLGESFDYIPAFDLSQADGEALRLHLKEEKGTVAFDGFQATLTQGDEVAESSGQGPVNPDYDIKPDILAPGMHILTTKPIYLPDAEYSEAYTSRSGAAMSAAQVTGIVALLKQAHPDWTPFDIKVALSNTAKRLDPKKYDVFAQGAGRVQAYAAVHPEVLAYAQDEAVQNETGVLTDNLKGTVTFGVQSIKEKNIKVSKKILVKDISGAGGEFEATAEVTKPYGDAEVTVDKPAFTLSGEQELTVTLTASKNENVELEAEVLGYVHLSKGDTTISLPFAAGLSDLEYIELENIRLTETDLSPNGDGVKDQAEMSFGLTDDLSSYKATIFNLKDDPEGGTPFFSEMGVLFDGQALKKGKHAFTLDGTYKPWYGDPRTVIPEGVYSIQFIGFTPADDEFASLYASYMPFFVKTSKPEITGSVSSGTATGKVADKYLDFNQLLAVYESDYDLNEKLDASYTIARNGQAEGPVPFNLNQDGSFSVPVPTDDTIDKITIGVTDAAGNRGEAVIYEK
ncbi:S8 family serine peptidase [Planomicrobium sp. CPCC 101110]|uniref:S8 family serine peptidase n=1 Tax=Planomicrobium sp. CPCC 101110 TaxID=2599619 RepID=UPI0011B498D9|nr:S8 family serine peptidase [Planomicrobium sp. CPCC 101110]TWT27705.1 S8 family serine peptidase [Planomicrobium sp. CPCC 101110]